MSRSSAGVLSALAAVAIAVAGCGGGSKSSTGGSPYEASSSSTTSTTKAAAVSAQAVIATKSNPVLGTILAAGPKKLTVYMFAADKGEGSACYGACAVAWPPVTTTGSPKVEGGASASKLGTIKRTDGTTQVTYAGFPLYYYAADASETDIAGQGVNSFGALWYVLSPSGEVVKKA